jgi:hypothetical protein
LVPGTLIRVSTASRRRVGVSGGVLVILALAGFAANGACRPVRDVIGVGAGGSGAGGQAGAGGTGAGGSAVGGATGAGGAAGGAAAGGSSATGGASGAGGNTLANFATVHDVVFTLCGGSGCHEPNNTPPALLVDDAKLYSTLMTYVSPFCGNRVLVKPGSPQDSAFYMAQAGQCGNSLPQMPLGCVDNCTPPDYLQGIWQWIDDGAPEQ